MKLENRIKRTDNLGFYGEYGGAFIPEILNKNVEELKKAFEFYCSDEAFKEEYVELLNNYVGRPTPLYYSSFLSKKCEGRIYLKREDLCHTGAHKINNTIGQILLAKKMGKKRIIAETGAGQHGVATATVCALMGLKCVIYMGEKDMERQAPNVERIKLLGAEIIGVNSGSKTLKDATNEAIRDWMENIHSTFYVIGSVVGPDPYPEMVAYFQSIISQEIKVQMNALLGAEPEMIIACVGGGSNAAGAYYHFIESAVELVAVEAAGEGLNSGKSAATSFLGSIGVLHGSMSLLMQTEGGQIMEPHSISAGLDYPGIGPLHAALIKNERLKTIAVKDEEAVKAGIELSKNEGIIPALESAHAVAALNKLDVKGKVVVLNLSGRGDKDLNTYINY